MVPVLFISHSKILGCDMSCLFWLPPVPLYISPGYRVRLLDVTYDIIISLMVTLIVYIFDTYCNNLHLGKYDLHHLGVAMHEHLCTWTWTINYELRCYSLLIHITPSATIVSFLVSSQSAALPWKLSPSILLFYASNSLEYPFNAITHRL
jgi:hypothetical protein